jgi:hypothetical protein
MNGCSIRFHPVKKHEMCLERPINGCTHWPTLQYLNAMTVTVEARGLRFILKKCSRRRPLAPIIDVITDGRIFVVTVWIVGALIPPERFHFVRIADKPICRTRG